MTPKDECGTKSHQIYYIATNTSYSSHPSQPAMLECQQSWIPDTLFTLGKGPARHAGSTKNRPRTWRLSLNVGEKTRKLRTWGYVPSFWGFQFLRCWNMVENQTSSRNTVINFSNFAKAATTRVTKEMVTGNSFATCPQTLSTLPRAAASHGISQLQHGVTWWNLVTLRWHPSMTDAMNCWEKIKSSSLQVIIIIHFLGGGARLLHRINSGWIVTLAENGGKWFIPSRSTHFFGTVLAAGWCHDPNKRAAAFIWWNLLCDHRKANERRTPTLFRYASIPCFSMFHNISHMMELVFQRWKGSQTWCRYKDPILIWGSPHITLVSTKCTTWSAQSFQQCQLLLSPLTISESVPP